MEQTKTWTRLSYKSAFFFFFITIGANLIFTPLITKLGVSQQASLFIVNSLGMSAALSYVLLVMNKMYRNKKQAILWSGMITIMCTVLSYALVYLG